MRSPTQISYTHRQTDPLLRDRDTLTQDRREPSSLSPDIAGDLGRGKKNFCQRLEGSAKLALQRAIKAACDPAAILNLGCAFDLAPPPV
jgi:hypothetical protein